MPKYVLNSLLAGVFSITFSATPYAHATDDKPASNGPLNQIKTHIKDTKLVTTKSYPEMFARLQKQNTKVNPLVFKQIAEAMSGEKFPDIQVQEFTYKGKDALKVMVKLGGEHVVVEYLFHGDEIMKINGTVFNTADTVSSEAFDAKLKTIEAFHKVYQQFQKKVFSAATVPTLKQWKKLTRAQRAEYFLRHRQLLEAAYKVHNTGRFKVVSNNDKTFEQWVQSTFLGEDAFAEATTGAIGGASATVKPPPLPPGTTEVTSRAHQEADAVARAKTLSASMGNPDQFAGPGEARGPSCIVAGYAREWKGAVCPWDGGGSKGADKFYKDNPMSQECRDENGKGFIACNPLIYGFNSTGKPHCINTATKTGVNENFNYATHGDGPCEKRSPLNTASDKMAFIKGILEREKIPGKETLKCKDDKGVIKKDGECDSKDTLITTDPTLFKKIMGELSGPISKYIDSAKKICEEKEGKWNYRAPNPPSGKSAKPDPAFQDNACDALMKRAIAVQNLLSTEETKPGATIIASPCSTWTPTDCVKEVEGNDGAKTCGCCKQEWRIDTVAKMCFPLEPSTDASGAEADPAADPKPPKDPPECGGYFSRMNPMNDCPSPTGGDWFKTLLGVVGGICLSNAVFDTHITGLCASKRKTEPKPNSGHVDPVPPCPATGCPPITPVHPPPPPEPPRELKEEVTNQNSPVYNPIQVPPR
jgi:hypothetical protein